MKLFLAGGLSAVVLLFGAFAWMHSQTAAGQTQRFAQFENEDVKVWRSVVMPNASLAMHRHEHPRVIIPLTGGTMKIVDQGGTSEEQSGKQARLIGFLPIRRIRCMPT